MHSVEIGGRDSVQGGLGQYMGRSNWAEGVSGSRWNIGIFEKTRRKSGIWALKTLLFMFILSSVLFETRFTAEILPPFPVDKYRESQVANRAAGVPIEQTSRSPRAIIGGFAVPTREASSHLQQSYLYRIPLQLRRPSLILFPRA